ncbi:MAG: hypothetical protein JRI25_23455 [Deltaproteobacteria bacterium]|nr:hypothetical protein [Deltaproteobacteria bacterium]MBW2257533.1 hypothetical protein [Deltaproteobacteria bacterium]
MNRWMIVAIMLTALCALEGARILGPALSDDALAQVPGDDMERVLPTEPGERRLCKLFETDVGQGAMVETSDRTTEVGQWVAEQEEAGWRLHDLDFEVAQKSTGYPQGFIQVCLAAR